MAPQTAPAPRDTGNADDPTYGAYLANLQARFRFATQPAYTPLFTTDAGDLFEVYLKAFPKAARQHHTCNACKSFLRHYGSLVTIDADGRASSVLWHESDATDPLYRKAIRSLRLAVELAPVTGVFISDQSVWGYPRTGIWTHLSVTGAPVWNNTLQTAPQRMAELKQDYETLTRALGEFSAGVLLSARNILEAGNELDRSEKALGVAKWVHELSLATRGAGRVAAKRNKVWRAVATAPAGWCHIRSSMIGTLLEDLQAGLPLEDVKRRWNEKMHPLQYQRPTAPPKAGTIARAETIFARLEAGGALKRRAMRLDEVPPEAYVWQPKPGDAPRSGGLFSGLRSAQTLPAHTASTMTWTKFVQSVLPYATALSVYMPARGPFAVLTTAEEPGAPPLMQWDAEERRNPACWYLYVGGSLAHQWGQTPAMWTPIVGVITKPPQWYDLTAFSHFPFGHLLLLRDAMDGQTSKLCLFPEALRAEFREVKSVIEQYSNTHILAPSSTKARRQDAAGLLFDKGDTIGVRLRVAIHGGDREYVIDRWD